MEERRKDTKKSEWLEDRLWRFFSPALATFDLLFVNCWKWFVCLFLATQQALREITPSPSWLIHIKGKLCDYIGWRAVQEAAKMWGKRGDDECFSVPRMESAFLRKRLLNSPFLFDLSQPFPPLTVTKQPPKYLWKCKAGTSAALIAPCARLLWGRWAKRWWSEWAIRSPPCSSTGIY